MSHVPEQIPLPLEAAAAPAQDAADARAISREALNLLPIRSYQGPVELVDADDAVADAVRRLGEEEVLGFDTETKPVFQAGISHPPALVQLAGATCTWIFQLRRLTKLEPLLDVLANARILKAGIALADDLRKLRDVQVFQPANFVEVGELARKLGITQTGLRTLAGLVLGFRVSKREQRSNWARAQLTPSQITYAATDAWVSRELYLALSRKVAEQSSVAPQP